MQTLKSSANLDQNLAAKVDTNPDRLIKATNFPGYKEDVEVAPGTKLNIGPVTDKSGNPVQVLVSFGRDSQGKTTADVQVTPRPDLTPGSAEAPNVRPLPDTSPSTNPSNNPDPNENVPIPNLPRTRIPNQTCSPAQARGRRLYRARHRQTEGTERMGKTERTAKTADFYVGISRQS